MRDSSDEWLTTGWQHFAARFHHPLQSDSVWRKANYSLWFCAMVIELNVLCHVNAISMPQTCHRISSLSGQATRKIKAMKSRPDGSPHFRRCQRYLNNIVEQDHRAIKRITRSKLGFKSFWRARTITAGIEVMHMIRKGQMDCSPSQTMPAAQQFYSLAV